MHELSGTEQQIERIEWVDILKGLAIILVVMGHVMTFDPSSPALLIGIYSFHMPLFMLLAGYTAAVSMERSTNVRNFISKRIIGLFIPYLVWSFMISPFADLAAYQEYSLAEHFNHFLTGTMLTWWFLPCLLMLQLLYSLYTVATARFKSPAMKICLVILLLSITILCHKLWGDGHCGKRDIWDLTFISKTYLYFIPFGVGVALRQYPKFKSFCLGTPVCTACVLIVLLLTRVRGDLPSMFCTHLRTVIGVAASLLLIRMFSGKLLPEWVNSQLRTIGKDTLIIYLLHFIFMPSACTWLYGIDGTLAFLVYLPICLAICYFCMATGRMIATSPWLSLLMLGKPLRRK